MRLLFVSVSDMFYTSGAGICSDGCESFIVSITLTNGSQIYGIHICCQNHVAGSLSQSFHVVTIVCQTKERLSCTAGVAMISRRFNPKYPSTTIMTMTMSANLISPCCVCICVKVELIRVIDNRLRSQDNQAGSYTH